MTNEAMRIYPWYDRSSECFTKKRFHRRKYSSNCLLIFFPVTQITEKEKHRCHRQSDYSMQFNELEKTFSIWLKSNNHEQLNIVIFVFWNLLNYTRELFYSASRMTFIFTDSSQFFQRHVLWFKSHSHRLFQKEMKNFKLESLGNTRSYKGSSCCIISIKIQFASIVLTEFECKFRKTIVRVPTMKIQTNSLLNIIWIIVGCWLIEQTMTDQNSKVTSCN